MPSSGEGLGQNFLPSPAEPSTIPVSSREQGQAAPSHSQRGPELFEEWGSHSFCGQSVPWPQLRHSQEFLPNSPPQPALCRLMPFLSRKRLLLFSGIIEGSWPSLICAQRVKSLGYNWKHPQWLSWVCRGISQSNNSQRNQMQQLFPFFNTQTSTELISAAVQKGASCFIPKSAWLWRKNSFLGNFLCWLKATG